MAKATATTRPLKLLGWGPGNGKSAAFHYYALLPGGREAISLDGQHVQDARSLRLLGDGAFHLAAQPHHHGRLCGACSHIQQGGKAVPAKVVRFLNLFQGRT